ncbi:hypothetical protein ACMFMG_009344 [Clarireedia jacksonii]
MASNEIYRYGEEPTHLSLRERLRQSRLEKAVAREAARAKEAASAQTPISPVISEEIFDVNDNCRNCDAASQTEFSVSPSSVRIELSQSLSEQIANAGNRELRDLVVKLIARCSGAREVAEDYFRENGFRDDESEKEGDAGDGEEDQREEDEEPVISARKRSSSSVLRLQVLEDSQESIHRDELDPNSTCPSPQLSDDSRDLGYISGGDNSTSGTVVHDVGVVQPSSISARRSEDYRKEGLEFIPRDDSNFDTTIDLRTTQLSADDEARPEHSVGIVQASNHSLSDGYNLFDVPAASVTTTSLKDAEINVSSLESSHEPSESQAFSKEIENECEKPIPEEKSRNSHTTPWLALILAEPENCPCDVDIQKDHESERDIDSKTSDQHALPDNKTIGGNVQEDGLVSREGGSVSPENGPVNHSGNFTPDLEDRGSVDASSENGTLIFATASKSYTDMGTKHMEGDLPIVDAISEHSTPISAPTSNSHNDIHTEHAEEGPQTVDEISECITAIPLHYSESHSDMDTERISKDQAHQVIIIDPNLDHDEEETESGLIPSSHYICETCRQPCALLQGHTINIADTQATTCLHCIARAAYQQATGCPTLRFRLDDSIRGESPACSRLSTPLPSARPSVESLSRLGTPFQSEPIAEKDFGMAGMDATSQTPQSNSASPKVFGQEEPISPQEDVVIETYIKGDQLVNGFQADMVNQSSNGIQPTEECRFNERDKDTIIVKLPANFDSELSNSRWRKRKRHTKLDDTGSLEDNVSSPIPPKRRRGRPSKNFRVDTELLPQNPISPSLPLPNLKRRRGRPPGSKNRSKLGTWPDQGRSDVSMDRCTADTETNPQSRTSTSHAFNADGPEGTPEKFHESADITYPTASTPPESPYTGPLPHRLSTAPSNQHPPKLTVYSDDKAEFATLRQSELGKSLLRDDEGIVATSGNVIPGSTF